MLAELSFTKEADEPNAYAIVWRCCRTTDIIYDLVKCGYGDIIRHKTGLA